MKNEKSISKYGKFNQIVFFSCERLCFYVSYPFFCTQTSIMKIEKEKIECNNKRETNRTKIEPTHLQLCQRKTGGREGDLNRTAYIGDENATCGVEKISTPILTQSVSKLV